MYCETRDCLNSSSGLPSIHVTWTLLSPQFIISTDLPSNSPLIRRALSLSQDMAGSHRYFTCCSRCLKYISVRHPEMAIPLQPASYSHLSKSPHSLKFHHFTISYFVLIFSQWWLWSNILNSCMFNYWQYLTLDFMLHDRNYLDIAIYLLHCLVHSVWSENNQKWINY